MGEMDQLRQKLEQALEQHRRESGDAQSEELLQRLLAAVQDKRGDDAEPAINGPCVA